MQLRVAAESGVHALKPNRRDPSARRAKQVTLLVFVVALIAMIAWLAASARDRAIIASNEARAGELQLTAGVQELQNGGFAPSNTAAAAALVDFRHGEEHFTHARDLLDRGRLVGILGLVPLVGRQLAAGTNLADMGIHLSRIGEDLAQAVGGVRANTSVTNSLSDPGQQILSLLAAVEPTLPLVQTELARIREDRGRIPSWGLIPPLSTNIGRLDAKMSLLPVGAVSDLRADIPGIRSLLSANGPTTYLVLDQDPAELRGSGGFVGTIAFLSFNRGKMAPFEAMDVDRIDTGPGGVFVLGGPGTANHVDLPPPLHTAFPILPSWELRDANWSPDFPTAAQQSEFLLQREAGIKVGGVVAIDPYLVERLLTIAGPVKVPETGDIVDQHNFFSTTFKRSELDYSSHRKDFVGHAANAIVSRVLALPSNQWPAVLDAIRLGCDTRSLQAYFHDAQAEALAKRHNCGGQVQTPRTDSVMVVEANVGGNKDDFWMKRSYSLQIGVNTDGTSRHTLKLHHFDLTSHGDLTGPYRGWLRLYLPSETTRVSVNGAKLDEVTELGRRVLQGWFYVQFNQAADVTVIYDEPAPKMSGGAQHLVLLWQKQAGLPTVPIEVTVEPSEQWRPTGVTGGGNQKASSGKISTDLSVDRQFVFERLK